VVCEIEYASNSPLTCIFFYVEKSYYSILFFVVDSAKYSLDGVIGSGYLAGKTISIVLKTKSVWIVFWEHVNVLMTCRAC